MRKLLVVVALFAAFGVMSGTASASYASRINAERSAKQYLEFEAFSRTGLIHQLKYEGYSTYDATWGVNHSGANWFVQAKKSARQYLRTMPFSRSSLIQQLEFEGFTPAQAVYGVNAVGL